MITRLHISQLNIRANRKDGGRRPVISVKTYRSNLLASGVEIHGPSRLIYSPDKPLSCGAVLWLETEAKVTLTGQQPGLTVQPRKGATCRLPQKSKRRSSKLRSG